MRINTDPKKVEEDFSSSPPFATARVIKEVLTRGVEEVINKSHLEKRLKSDERLRIKFGIDPTSADLHLGHSIPLKKLKQFQELGHQVIFLIGDFTARIGDPSARLDKRRPLTEKEIKKNMQDYIRQAAKILNMKQVEVRYNSEWYEKKGAAFLMDLTSRFTYARLIERDEFKKRIAKDIDISMLELIYPLLQGYDSVELKSDIEIGGADQKFNLLFARRVQKKYQQPQQDIITVPLLIGIDGARKMSKFYGNYIKLEEKPAEMFGKIMSISDNLIISYFELLTDVPLKKIDQYKKVLQLKKINPRDSKEELAFEITKMYHSQKAAEKTQEEFNKVFKEKKLPSKILEIKIEEEALDILDLLVKTKLAPSKSEAKRLIIQKGVKIDGRIQNDWRKMVKIKKEIVIQVGKRKFVKVV